MRWAHLDIDDDGTSDALDIHFRFDVKDRKSTNSLKPKNVRSDVGAINGDTVRDAVLDLNVSTHYNALKSEDYGIAHRLSPVVTKPRRVNLSSNSSTARTATESPLSKSW